MSNPGPAASEEANFGRLHSGSKFPPALPVRQHTSIQAAFLINAPFSLPSNRRCGRQENEPRRGMGARWRGSGHGYYFLLRKSFLTGNRKIAHKCRLPLPGRAAVENRHAGTGEGISSDGQDPCRRRAAASRLWHL